MGQRKRKSSNVIHQEQICLTAIENNDSKQLKAALDAGADVNFTNIERKSLFYLASKENNKEILKILITHKDIDIYARDAEDFTPLHTACELGLTTTVQSILNNAPQTANMCSKKEWIPLHTAAYFGQRDCVNILLTHDIKIINHQDDNNNTALHIACWARRFNTMLLLIHKGADPIIKNNQQTTPLICIFSADNENLLQYYLSKFPRCAHTLIHTKDTQDNSQFHLCTTITSIDPVRFERYLQFLTRYGLNIHARNKNGKRAVDLACDAYDTLSKQYNVMQSSDLKKKIINQEQIMHAFLRYIAPRTSYALFKETLELFAHLLQQQNINNQELSKRLIAHIMCNFYALHIETIIAQKFKNKPAYYDCCIENKQKIRQQLFNKPEPKLLWSAL